MKLTFLGTAHGVPLSDRFCSCTMIESGDGYYLIDAGAPAADLLLRNGKEIQDLRAIFITHAHSDHTCGIYHIANLMSWYYTKSSADFYLTNDRLRPALEGLYSAGIEFDFSFPERLRFHVVEPGATYSDGDLSFYYIPNGHMPHSYSILVTEKSTGKRVLFSGDLSAGLARKDVPEILSKEPVDAFVCEMAHFGTAELSPYLDACKAKAVYFNHVFPLSKYDDIEALKGKYSFDVCTPADGDALEL